MSARKYENQIPENRLARTTNNIVCGCKTTFESVLAPPRRLIAGR